MNPDSGLNEKAASFLARLRGESPALPPPAGPAAAGQTGDASEIPGATAMARAAAGESPRLAELERRIEELTRRLESQQVAASAPTAAPASPFPPVPASLQAASPRPPSDVSMFLQTRMELLETKLRAAQEESLRYGILYREREEAQRQAREQIEEIFRTVRERSRAEIWDAKLRQQYIEAQDKIDKLESQVRMMESGWIPAAEILRFWETEEGRAVLIRRIQQMAAEAAGANSPESPGEPRVSGASTSVAASAVKRATPPASAPQVPPSSPASPSSSTAVPPSPFFPSSPESVDPGAVAILMGRLADLERRLHESEAERDKDKTRRLTWEKDMLAALIKQPERWKKRPGAEAVAEAAVESMVAALRERDALADQMSALVAQIQQEPPDSPALSELRTRLAAANQKMDELQPALDRHMSVVRAWLKQD